MTLMSRAKRRIGHDDSGAALVLVLIFTTVVAVVVAVVMGMVQTSLRTTLAMRTQAAEASVADAAAQVAINQLRQGTYLGVGECFGATTDTLTLSDLYSGAAGSTATASVKCVRDQNTTDLAPINTANHPKAALLTLDTGTSAPGINIDIQGSGGTKVMKVRGGVFSNSTIALPHGLLDADWVVARKTPCDLADINATSETCPYTAPDTRGQDPMYDPPTQLPTGDPAVANCTGKTVYTLSPGRYTSATKLNALTSTNAACREAVVWMKPGVYWLDFDDAWVFKQATVFGGGGPTAPDINEAFPGFCPSPVAPNGATSGWNSPNPGLGVTIVLGGKSRIFFDADKDAGGRAEFCGDYSETRPPIVFYGLKTAVGGAYPVSAQNGCSGPDPQCVVISSNPSNYGYQAYINGTTYLPKTAIDLHFKKDDQDFFFRGGVTAFRFGEDGPGNTIVDPPMVETPGITADAQNRTVLWLEVSVCPNGGTCRVRLKVKVSLTDATGTVEANKRQVRVLSWSVQR